MIIRFMATLETYAQWLKAKRREQGLTQEQLAEASGLGRTYVNAIENGRIKLPQFVTRQKLHDVFGSDEAELIDLELMAYNGFNEEYVPERTQSGKATHIEAPPLSDFRIDGLGQIDGGPHALLGAARVYAFRAMNGPQRQKVLALLQEVDNSLRVSNFDDVPF